MGGSNWRERAGTLFTCEKKPAHGSRGMVASNHPLASAAGMEMLAGGGNAIDAAVATQFALTVVEPMMVGLIGGTTCHIRLADGSHRIVDGMSAVPLAGKPDMYRPIPGAAPEVYDVEGRENAVGPKAVATPGSLLAWAHALRTYGTMSLADVMQPAIRHAARGFTVTPYLSDCIQSAAPDLLKDKLAARRLLPNGTQLKAGERLVQGDYAEALQADRARRRRRAARRTARRSSRRVHGEEWRAGLATRPHRIQGDRAHADPRPVSRLGADRSAAARRVGRAHHADAEHPRAYDVAKLGFGTVDMLHLLAEVLKIAFADRGEASGDPAFMKVPVERITSKAYANERRAEIDMAQARQWTGGLLINEGADTTHLTTADGMGNVVCTTQTINSLFGARFIVPGIGMVPNDYMGTFDPRPGKALSIAPGKRVTTSMSPFMALREGKIRYALGLPGGRKIFPSVLQALVNLIDHGMELQEAVEAPRIWTEGPVLEVEHGIPPAVRMGLEARGHKLQIMPTVAGGMNGIQFHDDGTMSGTGCWRADGSAVGLGGGLARAGVRFVLPR